MLSIRLQRVGRRGDPAHRVVVQDHTQSPKSGRCVEILGSYNPRKAFYTIDNERASYYVANGAQLSETVHNLFVDEGIISEKKVNALPRKSPIQSAASESEEDSASTEGSASEDAGGSGADESAESEQAAEDEASADSAQEGDESAAADGSEEGTQDAEAEPTGETEAESEEKNS